ncbi:Conserved_hypothetical protein [Hexamita inflata]|uniref:Uncharacterized protein n=1 Tax=Hexamita inflata TaxID=28002 RepID=A0AA86TBN6_9EUKA|nr:Conserved hypothetical protein [Hexamita inflata]
MSTGVDFDFQKVFDLKYHDWEINCVSYITKQNSSEYYLVKVEKSWEQQIHFVFEVNVMEGEMRLIDQLITQNLGFVRQVYILDGQIIVSDDISFQVVQILKNNLYYNTLVNFSRQCFKEYMQISQAVCTSKYFVCIDTQHIVYYLELQNSTLKLIKNLQLDIRQQIVAFTANNKFQVAVQFDNSPHVIVFDEFHRTIKHHTVEMLKQLNGESIDAHTAPQTISNGFSVYLPLKSALVCCPIKQMSFVDDQLVLLTEYDQLIVSKLSSDFRFTQTVLELPQDTTFFTHTDAIYTRGRSNLQIINCVQYTIESGFMPVFGLDSVLGFNQKQISLSNSLKTVRVLKSVRLSGLPNSLCNTNEHVGIILNNVCSEPNVETVTRNLLIKQFQKLQMREETVGIQTISHGVIVFDRNMHLRAMLQLNKNVLLTKIVSFNEHIVVLGVEDNESRIFLLQFKDKDIKLVNELKLLQPGFDMGTDGDTLIVGCQNSILLFKLQNNILTQVGFANYTVLLTTLSIFGGAIYALDLIKGLIKLERNGSEFKKPKFFSISAPTAICVTKDLLYVSTAEGQLIVLQETTVGLQVLKRIEFGQIITSMTERGGKILYASTSGQIGEFLFCPVLSKLKEQMKSAGQNGFTEWIEAEELVKAGANDLVEGDDVKIWAHKWEKK